MKPIDIFTLLFCLSFLWYIFYKPFGKKLEKENFIMEHFRIREDFRIREKKKQKKHKKSKKKKQNPFLSDEPPSNYIDEENNPNSSDEETNPSDDGTNSIDNETNPSDDETNPSDDETNPNSIDNETNPFSSDEETNPNSRDDGNDKITPIPVSEDDENNKITPIPVSEDDENDKITPIPVSEDDEKIPIGLRNNQVPISEDDDDEDLEKNINLNYNTKKYYCNSYRNHLSLFPNTKKKMKIKTPNGTKDYHFQPEDICCINGDPKHNFKKKYVKCCILENREVTDPPNCNDMCLG